MDSSLLTNGVRAIRTLPQSATETRKATNETVTSRKATQVSVHLLIARIVIPDESMTVTETIFSFLLARLNNKRNGQIAVLILFQTCVGRDKDSLKS
jgi:hypothetical protein